MEKNKNLENEKKKKVPFNVFSKKGLMAVAMAGVMITTPFMLAGCADGQDGKDGQDGTVWKSGTSYTTFTDAKVGDYFIDTDDYVLYQKGANGWTVVMENFGKPGNNGQDGTSVYVGYDGYIWSGAERTTFKLENSVVDESVAEDTLGLYGNKYFTQNVVSTAQPIALMGNYFPTIKKTGYSGTTIKEISVYADKAGTLEIGTASVENIVNSRTNGTTLTTTTTAYPVVAGLNTIALNLSVADTDTVVLGGGTSNVNVYAYENVNGADEYGFYTVCDEQARTELFELTSNVKDKLVVKVSIATQMVSESRELIYLEDDFEELLSATGSNAVSASVSYTGTVSPFVYNVNVTNFENKIIDKFELPVKTLTDYTKDQVFTLSVMNYTTCEIQQAHKLTIPANTYSSNTVNEWISFDNLNISVGENETLAFYNVNDTIVAGHVQNKGNAGTGGFVNQKAFSVTNNNLSDSAVAWETIHLLPYNIYGHDITNISYSEHLSTLMEEEELAYAEYQAMLPYLPLQAALKATFTTERDNINIEFSILGDSISTYKDYSDGLAAETTNSTIATTNTNPHYPTRDVLTNGVTDTWWMQASKLAGLNILVNNSHSGDQVSTGGQTRCEQLHDNTGDNQGTNPDIIAVYLGINDYNNNVSVENFTNNYISMIEKIKNKYADAHIFVFTLLPNDQNSRNDEDLIAYNNAIRTIAQDKGCSVVDLYTDSGITDDNKSQYMADSTNLHPNSLGMDQITNCFVEALKDVYLTQE